MTLPPDGEAPESDAARAPEFDAALEPEFGELPPDPDERPPVELWSSVGDIPPWGTLLLVLAWAAVFATLALRGQVGDLDPLVAWGGSATGLDLGETAWRLLASTFLHAGAAHIFFNAATMLVVGPAVERIFARGGFWVVYALGGALASLASLLWRAAHGSGGVSVSGALLVGAFRLRHRLAPGRARALAGSLLFLLGQGFAAGFTRHATDNAAHAAGLVAGGLLGALIPISPRLGGPAAGAAMRVLGIIAALALAVSLALAVRSGLGAG
jgi:membrane associated rhomboid family serine protease